MYQELIKNKKWLRDCQEAHDNLREVCCNIDDNIKADEELEKHVKELFPIFGEIPWFNVYFDYQQGCIFDFGGILSTDLYLYIEFGNSVVDQVKDWFKESHYDKYTIGHVSLGTSNWCVGFLVKGLLEDINQKQIVDLHQQLAEESALFLDADNTEVQQYVTVCTEEDPHYLGVRFIEYTGKFPTYCMGDVVLEIEGERVTLSSYDVWGGIGWGESDLTLLKDCNLRWYERYRNEIIRVIKENVPTYCCGGCE